eukprot:COSAG04_NODE_2472_length_4065_cov_6.460161_3_plen_267_part_00
MPPPRPPLPWRTLADLDFPALRHLQAVASSRYPTPLPPPPAAPPPSSAVSLLSFAGQTGPCVLLLRKTGRGRHAAQLCLPGGFADDGDGGDLRRTCLRELEEETGLGPGPDGRGQVELLGHGPLNHFWTQKTGIGVACFAGSFDYMDAVYRSDACCGSAGRDTLGLPVDKNEIDRVLAVPLDMLCSARYARLCEDYHPTAALDQEGEEEWSGFTYTGPLFQLGSTVGRQAADNNRTSPVVWGLTARILAEYLTLLASVQEEEGSGG